MKIDDLFDPGIQQSALGLYDDGDIPAAQRHGSIAAQNVHLIALRFRWKAHDRRAAGDSDRGRNGLDGRAVLDRQQPFPDLHLKGSVLQRRPVGVQQLTLHLRRQLGDLQHDVDFAGRPGDVAVLIGHHGPVRVAVRDVLADGAPRHL